MGPLQYPPTDQRYSTTPTGPLRAGPEAEVLKIGFKCNSRRLGSYGLCDVDLEPLKGYRLVPAQYPNRYV